mmetsp:Transcript_1571/g.2273  ORF Transcript_1571/g.2273 Transcript_1571/m.2273 type:complete len:194 (-) Transcript_1571:244-825(-)
MEGRFYLTKTNSKIGKGGAYPEYHFIQNLFCKYFSLKYKTQSSIVSGYKSIKHKIKQLFNTRLLLKKTKNMINKSLMSNFYGTKKLQKYIKFNHYGSTRIIKLITQPKDILSYFQRDKTKKHILFQKPIQTQQKNVVQNKNNELVIPKAISNWKNPRGFSIPLHHRNNALNEIKINLNHKFIYLSNVIDLLDK